MVKLQHNQVRYSSATFFPPMRGMQWGLIGGLVGTFAMDLALMGGLPAMGLPADTCFATIGSTVRHFFSILGIQLAGDVTLGVVTYHLLGPLLGAIYGLLVSQVAALQQITLKKNLVYAVLYAEVLSQLILSMTPLLLKMPAQETALWFAGSFVLHLIWGLVLGCVMCYGLRAGYLPAPITGNAREQ